MKSQVRGPTCALAFRSYIDQFEDGKEITVQGINIVYNNYN